MTRVRDRFLTSDENSAAFVAYRRDRSVELRYFDELTQREIATLVGVSQMQISRVLRRALGQLNACDPQSS